MYGIWIIGENRWCRNNDWMSKFFIAGAYRRAVMIFDKAEDANQFLLEVESCDYLKGKTLTVAIFHDIDTAGV